MALVGNVGDRWQSALCDHELFALLRDRLKSAEDTQKRKLGSRVQLKNLICSVDGDLLVWHQEDCAFSTVRLRNLGSDPPGSGGEQKLLCINPPVFEVTDVLLSPTQNHIALLGAKGLMVLKVPDRWGKNSEFEGGKEDVNCRTIPIAERIFTCSTSLMLNQASWYPSELEEPRLVLLTSDNTIRIYNLQDSLTPEMVISLSTSDEETELPYNGRSYKASLGETAVAFDFGPLVSVPKAFAMKNKEETLAYPLYILYENGQTFMIYINLQESVGGAGKPLGPLPMHPAADDNYGYDACAVLCLPCVPNILVIATESGLLYHCVVLEGEEDDDQMSDKSWNPSMDLVPSLYVFECVELELALKLPSSQEETADSDFACPIKLHRDNCSFRFHCIHMAGVHSVAVTWLSKVQMFLNEGQEDKDNLLELAADQKCLVEHILCTKPLPSREPAPIQGFWIISDISLGTAMICITSDFDCITRPLMTNVHLPPPHLLSSQIDSSSATEAIPYSLADVKGSFESHIMGILSRNAANPLLLNSSKKDKSPSPEECLQLLSRATQVFREEYVLKQDLAEEEIQRRVKLLIAQKEKQLKDLSQCNEERKHLKEMAERLAEKFEEAKEKHDDLTNRFKKVLRAFHTQLPVLSDSEREMKKELQVTNGQLQYLENAVKQVKMKMSYQEKQMQKGKSPRKATLNLSGYKLKNIQSVLKEEGENIQAMVKQINNIRTHVNF